MARAPLLRFAALLLAILPSVPAFADETKPRPGPGDMPPAAFGITRDGRIQRVHRGYSEEGVDRIIGEINAALAAG